MSRSRRKRKTPKCICGRLETKYLDKPRKSDCTILHYVDEHNQQFLKYRERRSLPMTEED